MVSVSEGFKRNIDPKIIAHPANCMLMRHAENQRKNMKSSITPDDLMLRIKEFDEVPERPREPPAKR